MSGATMDIYKLFETEVALGEGVSYARQKSMMVKSLKFTHSYPSYYL